MAQIYLNICWGETPFTGEGWPAPLIRPESWVEGDEKFLGQPATAPDGLLERYQAAEKEFLAVQAELRMAAKANGGIGLWAKRTKMRSLTWERKSTPTWITW